MYRNNQGQTGNLTSPKIHISRAQQFIPPIPFLSSSPLPPLPSIPALSSPPIKNPGALTFAGPRLQPSKSNLFS